MSETITIRLGRDLAAWLAEAARRTGVPRGRLVRDQLERTRAEGVNRPFMRLAGAVSGPRDLSSRKGFQRP